MSERSSENESGVPGDSGVRGVLEDSDVPDTPKNSGEPSGQDIQGIRNGQIEEATEGWRLGGLIRPRMDDTDALRVAALWGLGGEVRELGSNQDRNFVFTSPAGRVVLKVANVVTALAELDAQHRALHRLRQAGLNVAAVIPSRAGRELEEVELGGQHLLARVLEFVEGQPLADVEVFDGVAASALGQVAAEVVTALADFEHEGCRRRTQWDLRLGFDVVNQLLEVVPEGPRRDTIAEVARRAQALLAPLAAQLPVQTIHADVTDDNVVVADTVDIAEFDVTAKPVVTVGSVGGIRDAAFGLIDLGDLQYGWRVAELATACAAVVHRAEPDDPYLFLDTVRAFAARVTLVPAEIRALWPLVALRTAVLVVSGLQQAQLDGDNAYAEERQAAEWAAFERVATWNWPEVMLLVEDACLRAAAGASDAGFAAVPSSSGNGSMPDSTSAAPAAAVMSVPKLHPLLAVPPTVVDLSVRSPLWDDGAWLQPGAVRIALQAGVQSAPRADARFGPHARVQPAPPVGMQSAPQASICENQTNAPETPSGAVTRWGEHRLDLARPLTAAANRATFALGVEVLLPEGTELRAPFEGHIEARPDGFTLAGSELVLYVDGQVTLATPLDPVPAGWVMATVPGVTDSKAQIAPTPTVQTVSLDRSIRATPVADSVHRTRTTWFAQATSVQTETLRLRLGWAGGVCPPFAVSPRSHQRWQALAPNPSGLFGVDVAAPLPDAAVTVARRAASFAQVQEHYYARPPQIERGWREFLIDEQAQVYVDAVNNVATTGHAHPRLTEVATRQWSLLNTNSRFNYEVVARFSERLVSLAPAGFDTVFLVNSGSEAVDLALRLALMATGRSRILAAREAYHGWTMASDAISTSLGDNPRALSTRPAWVELMDAPNQVRGTHRGPGAGPAYLADLDRQLEGLGEAGRADIAGVVIESLFGNGGGVLLPDGYLAGLYERVRAVGGLAIADEVQVGYGRLGHYFWGFEQQGAVPDIITIAKAMGNGQPLGAVLTSRAVAEAFGAEGSFFSSAGGSPVSCAIGEAVLDVMRDESLQENARVTGDRLAAALRELAEEHPAIGAVHGMGLYLGVELVSDRETFEPATALAAQVCERMLLAGCIVQPTGDHKNVLKVKPPLVLTAASADYFVARLGETLAFFGV